MKKCSKCKVVKPRLEFWKAKKAHDGLQGYCKKCHGKAARRWKETNRERINILAKQWRGKNPDKVRAGKRKNTYGVSQEEYKALRGNGLCPICGKTLPENAPVDHCHETGRVRGVLCNKCNLGIGLLRDNPKVCIAAASYLTLNA